MKIVDMGDIVMVDYGHGESFHLTKTGYYHLKKHIIVEFLKELEKDLLSYNPPKKIELGYIQWRKQLLEGV